MSALRQGYFPHQLWWMIDNPLRRIFVNPGRLADRLPLRSDSRVLEVGAGSGYFSPELARRIPGGRLEVVDVQPEMLAKARCKFGSVPPRNVDFTCADACDPLPFTNSSFDLVLLVAVLGELPAPNAALRSFFDLLAEGGHLAVHEHWPDPDRIPFGRLLLLIEAHGFRMTRRYGSAGNYLALFEKPRREIGHQSM